MPLASRMINFTTLFLKTLSSLISFVQKYYKSIIAITAAIVIYNTRLKLAVAWQAIHNFSLKKTEARLFLLIKSTSLYNTAVQACVLAQGLFNVAITLFTKGLTAARLQFALLTAAMAKNPLGLIAVALGTVVGLVLQFTGLLGKETKAVEKNATVLRGRAKALEDCVEAAEEASKIAAEEAASMEYLQKIIHDNSKSLRERNWAIKELQKAVPEYHASLNEEGVLTESNTEKIKEYLEQLKKKALAEALYERFKEVIGKKAKAELDAASSDKKLEEYEQEHGYTLLDRARYMEVINNPKALKLYDDRTDGSYRLLLAMKAKNDKAKELVNDEMEQLLSFANDMDISNLLDNLVATKGQYAWHPVRTNGKGGGSYRGGRSNDYNPEKDKIERDALSYKNYLTLQYQQGLITRRKYEEKLLKMEKNKYEKLRDLYKKGSKEWNEYEQKRLDLLQQERDQKEEWNMQSIQQHEENEKKAAQRDYLDGILNEEQYQLRLDEIRLEHLRRRATYYKRFGYTEKANQFESQVEAEELRQSVERRRKYLQKAKDLQNEYFKKSLDERQEDELLLLDELVRADVISEEKKQEYVLQIQRKYDKLREEEKKKKSEDSPLGNPTGIASDFPDIFIKLESLQAKLKDGKQTWEDYAAVAVSALAFVSTAMSSVTQLFSAQQQEEENAVTKRYDNEIKKVGENSHKGKKLEEQKQKELAAVKNKYRKKQMALEIAQAVASTAMAAINAYASASKVSWILGPIAAAMAVAAGGIQIAAIKKQHAAESSGYYEGGFTGGSDYRRRAGIVHQGEFVASHRAVQNPNVLPFLRLIDHAQRNNTIASLSAADGSRAIAAPQATANAATATAAAPALQVVDTASGRTADAIVRLNENLEAGIRASVSITGEDGFERQWNRYNKMKNRK